MLTDKNAILNRRLPHVDIECPGLGETVRVQAMSVANHQRFEEHKNQLADDAGAYAIAYAFLVYCIADENGALVFGPEDAESLGNLPVKDIELLFNAAQQINGLIDDEDEVKKS